MTRTALLVVVLLGVAQASFAQGVGKGQNCNVTLPPADAGFSSLHHLVHAVFPRNKAIGEKYSGCQTWWFPGTRTEWRILLVAQYDLGVLTAIRIPGENGKPDSYCRYKDGRLVSGVSVACLGTQGEFQEHAKSMSRYCAENLYDGGKARREECPLE